MNAEVMSDELKSEELFTHLWLQAGRFFFIGDNGKVYAVRWRAGTPLA